MGILDRIHRLVRANVNDLIDRSDVPEAALDHSIAEMESSIREARTHVRVSGKEEEKLAGELRRLREEAFSWEDKAMLALRQGEEELARKALVRKHELDTQADRVRQELERHRDYLADLDRSLDALDHKLDSARSRRRAMSPTSGRAKGGGGGSGYTFPSFSDSPSSGSKGSASSSSGSWDRDDFRDRRAGSRRAFAQDDDLRREYPEDVFGVDKPFRAFDEVQDRITQVEARLEAESELTAPLDDPLRDELADRFRRLERDHGGDRDVQALKERLSHDAEGSGGGSDSRADDVRRRLLEDLEG